VVRYLALISLTVFFASGLVVLVEARTDPVLAATAVRGPDQILSAPRYSQTRVERYARSIDCSRYIMKTIPIYYRLASRRNIAPDVLVAQAIVETGRGYYGGVSKPWNMAGIKKGGADRGDDPKDFEVPPTAYEGVRMHVNHMAAYTGKRPIARPLLHLPRSPEAARMVGEEDQPAGRRDLGRRPHVREQDPDPPRQHG
jgi:hypothetical protein